mgnify:CR=1 FL=1
MILAKNGIYLKKIHPDLKNDLDYYYDELKEAEIQNDVQYLREILQKVVSGFTPEENIVDIVHLQKHNKI